MGPAFIPVSLPDFHFLRRENPVRKSSTGFAEKGIVFIPAAGERKILSNEVNPYANS